MAKFKVGDEVRYIGDEPYGIIGTVLANIDKMGQYEVEFPGWPNGHSGSSLAVRHDRWWCYETDLELVASPISKPEPISHAPLTPCGGATSSRVGNTLDPYTLEDALSSLVVPTDAKERKNIPIVAGCLDYFPSALLEVAKLSKVGNDQHNPGQPLHWTREKSTDHAECIVRHLLDRGTVDTDGVLHSVKVAWRALALAQIELEEAGAKKARGAN